jgi:hypothetical protein
MVVSALVRDVTQDQAQLVLQEQVAKMNRYTDCCYGWFIPAPFFRRKSPIYDKAASIQGVVPNFLQLGLEIGHAKISLQRLQSQYHCRRELNCIAEVSYLVNVDQRFSRGHKSVNSLQQLFRLLICLLVDPPIRVRDHFQRLPNRWTRDILWVSSKGFNWPSIRGCWPLVWSPSGKSFRSMGTRRGRPSGIPRSRG